MYQSIKRFFDLVAATVGLLLLAPLLLPVVLLLRLTGEGEVWYFQERMGYRTRPFSIWKFATMLKNSPNMGNKTVTVRNDPRITPMGHFLRKSKINELPQIINVLLGHMSLVGPRPLLVSSFYKYAPEVQAVIYTNRPGITGIGSLVFRDEEKLVSAYKQAGGDPLDYYREHIYPYKGALERWYHAHQSFGVDLCILFLTFWSVVFASSQLVFKVFPSLPPKPSTLSTDWIKAS
jgi:lipopolysaccharide/colanic/teichoic acid biosynthesis glycosyltransferase